MMKLHFLIPQSSPKTEKLQLESPLISVVSPDWVSHLNKSGSPQEKLDCLVRGSLKWDRPWSFRGLLDCRSAPTES